MTQDTNTASGAAERFTKKPITITASQWFKPGDHPMVEQYDLEKAGAYIKGPGPYGWIKTLEGGHIVSPGDWIITGVAGEHYPCKPDIFAATYSRAALASAPASSKEYAEWVPVTERLPEPGIPVLLDIGARFPIRALWAAKGTVTALDDDSDWAEYDEETGSSWCPEGWYEWNRHEETHWAVNAAPIAWMELPATHALRTGCKPLTHEQAKDLVSKYGNDPLHLVYQVEVWHGIAAQQGEKE